MNKLKENEFLKILKQTNKLHKLQDAWTIKVNQLEFQ